MAFETGYPEQDNLRGVSTKGKIALVAVVGGVAIVAKKLISKFRG
jgi:hypothetical protein